MSALPPDEPETGGAGDELEVDLGGFLPEGVAIGDEGQHANASETVTGHQTADLAVLAGIEADLAAVDAALEAVDADDLRSSALLVGLLELDGPTEPTASEPD